MYRLLRLLQGASCCTLGQLGGGVQAVGGQRVLASGTTLFSTSRDPVQAYGIWFPRQISARYPSKHQRHPPQKPTLTPLFHMGPISR